MSCAGITRDEFLLRMSEDDWDKVIAVNLKVVTSEPVTSGSSSLGMGGVGGLSPRLILSALLFSAPPPQGIFLVTQAAAQALVSSGCPGSIINISSIIGKVRLCGDGISQPSGHREESPSLGPLTHPTSLAHL